MRGAYTAGCLSWLVDEGIEFDSAYGISTGAVHLCNFLLKDKKNLFDFSTKYIADIRAIGVRAFLRCGRIVDYDFLFDELLNKTLHFSLEPLKDYPRNAKIGLYDLDDGKTNYYPVNTVDSDLLKAACTLPIIGKIVDHNNNHYLDGGISDMIPIEIAKEEGNTRFLIITTKPLDYERKPSKPFVNSVMGAMFKKYPSVIEDYKVRHLNYYKQIAAINELVEKKEAIYRYPTETIKVSRLGGNKEDLVRLYELGRADMEKQRNEIYKLLKDD